MQCDTGGTFHIKFDVNCRLNIGLNVCFTLSVYNFSCKSK